MYTLISLADVLRAFALVFPVETEYVLALYLQSLRTVGAVYECVGEHLEDPDHALAMHSYGAPVNVCVPMWDTSGALDTILRIQQVCAENPLPAELSS